MRMFTCFGWCDTKKSIFVIMNCGMRNKMILFEWKFRSLFTFTLFISEEDNNGLHSMHKHFVNNAETVDNVVAKVARGISERRKDRKRNIQIELNLMPFILHLERVLRVRPGGRGERRVQSVVHFDLRVDVEKWEKLQREKGCFALANAF